ncbi:hypothetical protein [Pseudorhodoferax sp.]|uniref:hypothetical protein n=1 Tax=Pseudorhodoferax sp. TaxID=1993553 RepID=UPI002DD624A4|nr:hypothetical protein [Pseudorhodoferax sp.]
MSPLHPLVAAGADRFVADFMAVRAGESVVVTSDLRTDTTAVAAVFAAVCRAGARAVLLTIPGVPFQGTLADPYIAPMLREAVKVADVWIDMTFPYLAGSSAQQLASEQGRLRYALAGDVGADGLARLFATTHPDRCFDLHSALDALFSTNEGRRVRVTCPYGTDVSFLLAKPPHSKPRRAEKPGLYTLPGSCGIFPVLESVQGSIVLTSVFHEYFAPVSPPLRLQVDGRIAGVEGPTEHRTVLERALRRAGNGAFGHIIHFSCGINPSARSTGRSFIEDSRVIGASAVGMGLPWWVPGGGENHPDGVVSDQSMWIEDTQILDRGHLLAPQLLTGLAEAMAPDLSLY